MMVWRLLTLTAVLASCVEVRSGRQVDPAVEPGEMLKARGLHQVRLIDDDVALGHRPTADEALAAVLGARLVADVALGRSGFFCFPVPDASEEEMQARRRWRPASYLKSYVNRGLRNRGLRESMVNRNAVRRQNGLIPLSEFEFEFNDARRRRQLRLSVNRERRLRNFEIEVARRFPISIRSCVPRPEDMVRVPREAREDMWESVQEMWRLARLPALRQQRELIFRRRPWLTRPHRGTEAWVRAHDAGLRALRALRIAQREARAVRAAQYFEDAHPHHVRGNAEASRVLDLLALTQPAGVVVLEGQWADAPLELDIQLAFVDEYGEAWRAINAMLAECTSKPWRGGARSGRSGSQSR